MAAPQGFEPQLNEPESLVLPLHHGAASNCGFLSATLFNIVGHCRNASSKYKISGFFHISSPSRQTSGPRSSFPLRERCETFLFPAAGRKKVAIHFIRNYCIRKRFYLHRFRRRCRFAGRLNRERFYETAHLFARCRGNDVRVLFVYNAVGDEHPPFGS